MNLKLLILQMVLVAGAGERAIRNIMGKVLVSDFRAVLTALQRSDSHKLKLPAGTLDTEQTVINFLFDGGNAARIKKVMSEVNTLDLTDMNLRRLPIHVIQQLPKLNTLILDYNKELSMSKDEIKVIDHLPIEKVSIRYSSVDIEALMAFQELPCLINLDITGNKSLSMHMDGDKFGGLTTRLVELRVGWCDFDGSWLDAILKCVNLKVLDVSGNKSLFDNKASSVDCSSFMGGLKSLDVASCELSSAWLDDIFKCTSLVNLNIEGNTNIGADHTNFKNLQDLSSLKILNVDSCDLTTESLNEICKSKSLVELSVGHNDQLWKGEVDFGECRSRLVKLNIAGTEATGDVLRAISGPPRWKWPFSSLVVTIFGKSGFFKLANLNVSGNKALGHVMSQKNFSFGWLEQTLTELNVSDIGIESSSAIEAIGRCEGLLKLNASFNSDLWSGASGTPDFGYMKSRLQVLDVGSTKLPPAILSEILEFDKLVELKISHNYESCKGLGSNNLTLGGVSDTLRKIDMGGTDLTGEGLQWIFREFEGLVELNAMYNPLITPANLMGLDFSTPRDKLAEFKVSADDKILGDLRKKLPFTIITNK